MRAKLVALAFLAAGCVPMAPPDVPVSTVNLVSSSGAVLGMVRVFSEPTGLMLRIEAAGLPPGVHGVHLHAVGRCEPPGFTSAGHVVNGAPLSNPARYASLGMASW